MKINNCSSCGGKVEFSPDDAALKCLNCGQVFEIESKPYNEKRPIVQAEKQEGYKDWEEGNRSYRCSNCGAQIVLNKFEMSTKCNYCNTESLVPIDSLPGLKPDAVLPFKISKAKARDEFAKRIKKKAFVPNALKKQLPSIEISSMYISAFDFAMTDSATYSGMEAYTVTRHTRDGKTISETRYRPISGSITHYFSDIIVESSDKISQKDINEILPFNFQESYQYNDDFLKGYGAGYYDQDLVVSLNTAQAVAENGIERMIRNKYNTVVNLTVNHNFSDQEYNYSLLPVYFVNFKYKEKEYFSLMNGQNGNIGGKLPKSPIKISALVISILLILLIPILLIILI